MQKAIICDIDGTLAIMCNRKPYDYESSIDDKLNKPIAEILSRFSDTHLIILITGREETSLSTTEKWLQRNGVPYHMIFMRKESDYRKDNVVKREIFYREIDGKYEILFVLDDRNQVVDMWRKDLGLTCLQVNYGDF